jgi:hypothetical protein
MPTDTPPASPAESKGTRRAGKGKTPSRPRYKAVQGNGRPQPPGVIEPGCILTAEEARARLRFGCWAWRALRRAGLRTITVSGRSFVLSDDLIRFFGQQ